ARLPGNRAADPPPIHRRRRRQPRRPRRRSRGRAVRLGRPGDAARGDRARAHPGVSRPLPALRGVRLLGGDREGHRGVPRVVPFPSPRGRAGGPAGAGLPAAPIGLGQGLRHRGIAGADPEGVHRAGRRARGGLRLRGAPRVAAGHGEGGHAAGADVPPDARAAGVARRHRPQPVRRGRRRVRDHQGRVGTAGSRSASARAL
ncbi:MAG: Acetyltransferase, GNAT family, partial [uncultured Thermomicrobiales bacterium]